MPNAPKLLQLQAGLNDKRLINLDLSGMNTDPDIFTSFNIVE